MDYELRKEWLEKYLSKIADAMIEANDHAETPGEIVLMHKFAEVVENHLINDEEGENNEAL